MSSCRLCMLFLLPVNATRPEYRVSGFSEKNDLHLKMEISEGENTGRIADGVKREKSGCLHCLV